MKVYRVIREYEGLVSNCDSKIYSTKLNDLPFKENSTFFYLYYSDAVKLMERAGVDTFVIAEVDLPVEVLVDSIGVGHYIMDDYFMDEYDAFEFLIDNNLIKPRRVDFYMSGDELYKRTVDYIREFSFEPIYKPELNIFNEIKHDKDRVKTLLYTLKDKEKMEFGHIYHDNKLMKTIKP